MISTDDSNNGNSARETRTYTQRPEIEIIKSQIFNPEMPGETRSLNPMVLLKLLAFFSSLLLIVMVAAQYLYTSGSHGELDRDCSKLGGVRVDIIGADYIMCVDPANLIDLAVKSRIVQ
jgi:hypothetical protein